MILPFLAEGVCQPRETSILHSDREVRTFNVARANLAGLRLPRVLIFLATYYPGRAVSLLAFPGRRGELLNQHSVIDVVAEGTGNRRVVRIEAVR